MDADNRPTDTVMQDPATQARAGAVDPSAMLRGLAHGIFLSALIWAVIGWIVTLLR
ncbi:MAG TPA: hypothetical protein VE690_18795 [Rhodopila sp.]|nr:hypothetical protein [Rhodopila sp.]